MQNVLGCLLNSDLVMQELGLPTEYTVYFRQVKWNKLKLVVTCSGYLITKQIDIIMYRLIAIRGIWTVNPIIPHSVSST